ncbi:DUF6350 family protein [Microbacterium sp. SSW1-59]|uniref:cell division protein PerM n=1 Tax=Microbacterium xanthum TaxID=3079794 RepID=UPI002AD2B307|nr:DUF6350 family protein [Microbacterium sp. SSW1-59]MDZ8201434.1 DUF6350 family protein [Microbacterium sp. SSW1-59]
MHRLTVALLAAVDSVVAAAVGVTAVLAPMTLVWVFGLAAVDWGALWPASATIWQLGHLVPVEISLAEDYLVHAGVSDDAATFTVSLAPLAFTVFTAVAGIRSGIRASRAEAWMTGALSGGVVFTALALAVALTAANETAATDPVLAVVAPSLVYAVPLVLAAIVTEWREAAEGPVADVRDRAEGESGRWSEVPGEIARGIALSVSALVGAGALLVALAITVRIGEILALYQSAHVDGLGAVLLTLGQFAYLPTLIVWGMSFVAGPGVLLGTGAAAAPGGTTVGVLPGIPLLGVVPEATSTWLLLLVLVPIAVGAFAGWVARSRLATSGVEEWAPRIVTLVGIAAGAAGAVAMLSWAASGSIGPGRLDEVGPEAGAVALAVGLEVFVGAAILLLSPRGALAWMAGEDAPDAAGFGAPDRASETVDLGTRGERPTPPLD